MSYLLEIIFLGEGLVVDMGEKEEGMVEEPQMKRMRKKMMVEFVLLFPNLCHLHLLLLVVLKSSPVLLLEAFYLSLPPFLL